MSRQKSKNPVMLLVLGVHRSGTSVTARMLECLGAVPSTNLHEPLPNNPKGFFEDFCRAIQRIRTPARGRRALAGSGSAGLGAAERGIALRPFGKSRRNCGKEFQPGKCFFDSQGAAFGNPAAVLARGFGEGWISGEGRMHGARSPERCPIATGAGWIFDLARGDALRL